MSKFCKNIACILQSKVAKYSCWFYKSYQYHYVIQTKIHCRKSLINYLIRIF